MYSLFTRRITDRPRSNFYETTVSCWCSIPSLTMTVSTHYQLFFTVPTLRCWVSCWSNNWLTWHYSSCKCSINAFTYTTFLITWDCSQYSFVVLQYSLVVLELLPTVSARNGAGGVMPLYMLVQDVSLVRRIVTPRNCAFPELKWWECMYINS